MASEMFSIEDSNKILGSEKDLTNISETKYFILDKFSIFFLS